MWIGNGRKCKNLNTNFNVYIYDYCLFGQLIIEYDGEGFYHSSDEQYLKDKEKEEYAIQKGYKFFKII